MGNPRTKWRCSWEKYLQCIYIYLYINGGILQSRYGSIIPKVSKHHLTKGYKRGRKGCFNPRRNSNVLIFAWCHLYVLYIRIYIYTYIY
jgi:hypothetical protein